MVQADSSYPVQFNVAYPDSPRNRLTALFQIILVIPIIIVLWQVSGGSAAAGGILVLSPLLMILFRRKYPRWWFDWNLALLKFSARVAAYLLLMRDEYPSTDEEQSVHLEFPYPDVEAELNRWLPLVKWLLAIPHYIILVFLGIGAIIAVVISGLSILFTGRYPVGLFNFVVGTLRWEFRVLAYAFLLVTDRYPPFRLGP